MLPNVTGARGGVMVKALRYKPTDHAIIITKPTNALIVCNLFLNHFFKTLFTAPTCFDSISFIIIREHI